MITLKTLSKAKKQEVFDQVARHLLTQKKRSRKRYASAPTGYSCVYRNTKGLKCAAGCLISDEEFIELGEGRNTYDWAAMVDLARVTDKHKDLICSLQEIHDDAPVNKWHDYLSDLAKNYKLNRKALEMFQK